MAQELNDLINSLTELEDSKLTRRVEQIVDDFADGELSQAFGTDAFADVIGRWYGDQPGLLWEIIEKLRGRSPALASWANSSLRKLLKAPAEVIFDRSVLERNIKDTNGWTAPDEDVKRWFSALRIYLRTIVENADTPAKLDLVKQLWTNREGIKPAISKEWPSEARKLVGLEIKRFEEELNQVLANQTAVVANAKVALARERVDLSLPGVIRPIGSHHLIRQVFKEIEDIFFSIGFSVVEGPEIETPYYNFEALNIPEFHPVRDDMDTFYIELPKGAPTQLLLRTHTSPMQIRTMEKQKPPLRVIVPGKVYRRDNPDATHSFMFHQVEGLAVDADITFCDFTGTVEYFVKQFFGPSVKTRFRPSYFPFTEPSVELDASCIFCGGTGTAAGGGACSKCKGAAWIELFGAGMVDPAVYGFVNYDAKKVSGFAFGIGIDRMAMLKYGIDDIQVFFQNDVRFLKQFP
jgi:phenylalanyl-tRNA synthetase alpha chain